MAGLLECFTLGLAGQRRSRFALRQAPVSGSARGSSAPRKARMNPHDKGNMRIARISREIFVNGKPDARFRTFYA
jgi:hypothetical protein